MYILYGVQQGAIDRDGLFKDMVLTALHGQEFPYSGRWYVLFDTGIYLKMSALSNYQYNPLRSERIQYFRDYSCPSV